MPDIAPAPAAPSPSTPSTPSTPSISHEVVIDQNPVNTPAPVGSQAPPRREDDHQKPAGRPESRREVIARAFAKAEAEGRPGPAQAKAGHNQPPDETPAEKAAEKPKERSEQRPIDLRRPPPKRGDGGRFASTQREALGGNQVMPNRGRDASRGRDARPGQPPVPGRPVLSLPAADPHREAPQRMSPAARTEWAAAPASVRAEVHRMHREFGTYYQQSQADRAVMDTIRPYHQLAQSHGTTLDRALNNYVTMENKLRADPLGGLDVLVHNMNLRTSDGYQLTLRDIAHYVVSQTPEQHAQIRTQNTQGAHNAQITQLNQQVSQLAGTVQQMHSQRQYEQQYTQTWQGVNRFAETHPRLDELSATVVEELRAGHGLEQAYARANLLRPQTAAQTRSVPQAAQTRAVDRSISGAPSGAAPNGRAARRPGTPSPSRRDTIAAALRKVNGSL